MTLTKINGIGLKAVLDLKKHYNTFDELRFALQNDKVSLRDDQVDMLKKHFNIE